MSEAPCFELKNSTASKTVWSVFCTAKEALVVILESPWVVTELEVFHDLWLLKIKIG